MYTNIQEPHREEGGDVAAGLGGAAGIGFVKIIIIWSRSMDNIDCQLRLCV